MNLSSLLETQGLVRAGRSKLYRDVGSDNGETVQVELLESSMHSNVRVRIWTAA